MREILFRGKRKDTGEWVQGDLVHSQYKLGDTCVGQYGNTVGIHQVDSKTVGQFTGIYDMHHNMIFDGDICRNTITGEIVSAKWHGTFAGYVWSKRRQDSNLYDFGELFRAYYKMEVIGNIHDNPELLNGGETNGN